MPHLRAHNISVSLDGYMAGPEQTLENPLGVGGMALHQWVFATRAWQLRQGADAEGAEGVDSDFIEAADVGVGASILGRNMFGPVRGPWDGDAWTGWWGDDPPFHHPVFVLTHHARAPIAMKGGTVFHFVTEGIEVALQRAFDAAAGADVRLGGGASTIRQYMRAGLLDELHVAIVPILLGGGERPLDDLGGAASGYTCVEVTSSPAVVHVRLARGQQ